jgi:hypothetical protein
MSLGISQAESNGIHEDLRFIAEPLMNPAVDGCYLAGAAQFMVLHCALAFRDSLRVRFDQRPLDAHIGDLLFEWSNKPMLDLVPPYSPAEYLASRTNPSPRGEFATIA